MYEGWIPVGLGEPQPVRTAFLLGFLGRFLTPVVSPWGLFLAYVIALASIVLGSSARLLAHLKVPAVATVAGAAFALLNPWVYTEIVAGHLFMVAAYGATIAVAAEFMRPYPRTSVLVALSIVVMLQLQYALPVNSAILIFFLRRRKWIGAFSLLLIGSPSILGLLAYHHQLLAIPYLLDWQRDQSVAPLQALVFGGYSTHYAGRMLSIARVPMALFAGLAVAGMAVGFRNRKMKWVAGITALVILVVIGEKGPIAPLYSAAITFLPETGLFRELFDLLAFVAIGYLIAFAYHAAKVRWAAAIAVPSAAALVIAWIVFPPSSYWVNAATIPHLTVLPSRGRFALFPSFQPLQFNRKGSGIDPDAAPRFHSPTPLNEYLAGFPVDVALARYSLYGKATSLSALGVSRLYDRPYFESNTSALDQSIANAGMHLEALNHSVKSMPISAMQLTTVADRLVLASVASDLSRTSVFVGDVPDALANQFGLKKPVSVTPIPLQRTGVNPNRGWVDARLAFAMDPRLGQAFGGAYTRTSKRALPLPHADRILALVQGTLVADGSRWQVHTTHGYRWVRLPNDVSRVRCFGSCAIALAGNVDARMSRDGAGVHLTAVRSRWITPWLLRVDIPNGTSAPLLRVNDAFSPYWIAGAFPHLILPHVRVDTSVNGYVDPKAGTVYCIQIIAFAQLVLESAAALWCLILGFFYAKKYLASRSSRIICSDSNAK